MSYLEYKLNDELYNKSKGKTTKTQGQITASPLSGIKRNMVVLNVNK